jgi:PAS domain S-box-containing protein
MSNRAGHLLLHYACAVVSVAIAIWIRLLLDPALGNGLPFITVFVAIMMTAWYGGFRPALAAAVLGGLSANWFIMPPRGSFALAGTEQQVGMVLYCFISLSIVILGGLMQSARERAEVSAQIERRQASLIDQAFDAVLVWDWNGPITFWNRGAERLYGFPRAEALGRVSHELLRTRRVTGASGIVDGLERTGSWEGEIEHTTRDGTTILVETRMVLVRDAGRPYVLEANRDITQRLAMEKDLREAGERLEVRVRERTAELARTNESLQSSEERFRLLVEGVQEYAIFMLDLDGRVLTWNAGAERNKGYRAEEIIGRHFSCFYPEEDVARGKTEAELRQCLAEGRCEDSGWRVRKDGSRFWAKVVITTVYDKAGRPCGFAKLTRDITESKHAQERFEQAIASALNAMVLVDSYGKIVLVNEQTEKLFGYGRDEMLGQPVEMLIPNRFRDSHLKDRDEFFARPRVRPLGFGRDLSGRRKDGSEFTVDIALNPITSDEGIMVLCAVVDIVSERQRAEERFRLAVESAPNGMVMVNADGTIVLVNAETERLFGYDHDELLGQPVEVLVPEPFRPRHPQLRTAFFAAPQVRSMGVGRDLFGRRKDGSEFPVEIGLNPIATDHGVLILTAIVDITERKRSENSLRAERDRFAKIVSTVPVVICSFLRRADGTSRFPFANPAIEQIYGYSPEELAVDAAPIFTRMHPEDIVRVRDILDESARTMTPWRGEFRYRNAALGEIWVEGNLIPTAEPDGATLWLGYIADITERKRADDALRDRERLLSIVTGSARVGLVVVGDGYRYLFANVAYAKIFGLDAASLVGRRVPDALPAGWPQIRPNLDRALAGEQVAYELNLPPLPGEQCLRYFTVVYEPRRDIDGARTVVVVVVDISERKRVEVALLESEGRYRLAQQAARIASFEWIIPTNLNLWTPELEALYGLQPGEFSKTYQGWEGLVHPEDLAEAKKFVERALETSLPTEGEWRVIWPDESVHWIAARIQMFKDDSGKPHRVAGVNLDITERRRAEEALRESEQRLRLFIAHAPAALAMFDRQMRYVVVSRRWMEDYSLPDADIAGRSHYEMFPEVSEFWKSVHRRALAGEVVRADEDYFVRPDGRVQWLRWEVRPWYLTSGAVGGIVIFSEDITDRKQTADALRRLNADLARGVRELGEANRELKAKTQENEAFVYTVSHDLRSPLVNLQGFSKELERAARGLRNVFEDKDLSPPLRDHGITLLDGSIAKSLRFIQTAVGRLSSIIDALLRLSRAGRVIYQRQRVDTQAVVERVVDALKITKDERKATIRIDRLPAALGDPAAIEQVFANLVGNALNYLDPKRAGQIEIGSVDTDRSESTNGSSNESTTYFVRDNGLGIQEAGQAKVFQPFQRLHPNAAPGEGMGLAIVQRVVERHGGNIWFESTVGQGTTFFVSLPTFTEDASLTLSPAPAGSTTGAVPHDA